ncbi:MAG: hypothetical protein K6E32_06755 [Lachnospiraceae bacterium]|nr:hypothetical protein [Lachnospiraceae bacterium]
MSDMDNLMALKRMLEKKDEKQLSAEMDTEKRFIADATKAYLGDDTPVTGIQGYDPESMIRFLELPAEEVQRRMGGEWLSMPVDEFEILAYTVDKKIKKSTSLLDWKS